MSFVELVTQFHETELLKHKSFYLLANSLNFEDIFSLSVHFLLLAKCIIVSAMKFIMSEKIS